MTVTEQSFHNDATFFLEKLFFDLDAQKIQIKSHWDIDHICYRADTTDNYYNLRTAFSQLAELLTESEVNGRPISTYKLDKSIQFREWNIHLIELPSPKKSKPTALGFEHIEVVCDIPFHELQDIYGHLKLDLGGLDKDFNAELEITLGERNIKFHHLSLHSSHHGNKQQPGKDLSLQECKL